MKISLLALLLCASGFAQTPLGQSGAPVLINNSDLAVLGTPEVRKDLPCTVSPNKPVLGFDLRFHAGFDVSIPMDELAGREDQLTILFRVTPQNDKDNPKYFIEHVHVPKIDEGAKGDATLSGGVLLGEGQYHVDWLMRDRSEQVCSFYWDSDAELASKDKPVELAIAPGAVESADLEEFTEEPPVARSQASQPLYIKILVNFAPQNSSSAELRPADTVALVTILRRIARQPQFGKFSLVAYNIQDQRVLYRQSRADKIDFPALGAALKQIKLGTVNLQQLSQKNSKTKFLANLIKTEISGDDHPDALIFAGPKIMLDESIPEDELKPFAADVNFPVFYMNYNLNPQAAPWKDSIGHAVEMFRGTEFTITRPRDLWSAVSEMVSRIVKFRHGRSSASASSQ